MSNSFLFCAWFIQHTKHSSEEHIKDEELMPTVYSFVFSTRNMKTDVYVTHWKDCRRK